MKKGIIFKPDNNFEWMISHASLPIAYKLNEMVLRIYFGTRDFHNRSFTSFIEVNINNPKKILYIHDKPILSPGELGCFDDSGSMPSCIVNYKNKLFLYYIGWNIGVTTSYHNSIGLAISEDNGLTFQRVFKGPIVDRNNNEPYFTGSSYVIYEKKKWKMWYLSSTGWIIINEKTEPLYNIKYAESNDGINWIRKNITCIDYKFENEAISRPCVIIEDGIYKMWYSYRGSINYRTNLENSYKIGYAESIDGINWLRKDEQVGIKQSKSGWDSKMIEYSDIFFHKGKKYMLYNGNGFGKSGFGYAILEN